MKNTRKFISVLLVALMLVTAVSAAFTVSAADQGLASYYKLNPNGAGIQKTISVDGDISDWDTSMIIAQGTANDDPRVYRDNSMYEIPIDMYALYGAYDSQNLYLMWEMTNVQDVVAPNDDYPLSQGTLYQTQNLPFFIAIDTGKSDAIGNSGKLTSGGTIWDSGLTFENSFNRLIAISTNGSNGPFIYSGSSAGLNAKEVYNQTTSGITFKWGKGINSKNVYGIDGGYGKNHNRVLGDMQSESSAWVDFNTKGHKSSSMDFHYEMSIPLDKLGITSSDVASNGVGALVIATFGKSGMDCLPYDMSMNDVADQADTESQAFNSLEKSDPDNITTDFARIGKGGGSTPTPTPQPTTQPVTQPATEADDPGATDLTVNAKSNIFTAKSQTIPTGTNSVTVKYDLTSAMKVVNAQWNLTYDTSKLKLTSVSMPNVSGNSKTNISNNVGYGVFSTTTPDDFTKSKTLVQAQFDVLGTGNATVNLNVDELSVGYLSGNNLVYKNAVAGGSAVNLSSTSGFTSNSVKGTASIGDGSGAAATVLTVNATSNFFPSGSGAVKEGTDKVTVTYKFSSTMDLINSQWEMTYDPTKLTLTTPLKSLMPNVTGFAASENTKGTVKGNFSELSLVPFDEEQAFVTATFSVIGTGTTTVNLNVKTIGIGDNKQNEAYIVDKYNVQNVTSVSGFSGERYTTKTEVNAGGYMMGDVNGDGAINVVDATAVQRKSAGLDEFDERQMIVGDVNYDGNITVVDATQIQKYAAGLITSFD